MKVPVIVFGDFVAAYGVIRALSPAGIPIHIVSQRGRGIATRSRHVGHVLAQRSSAPDVYERLSEWIRAKGLDDAVVMVAGDDHYLEVLARGRDRLPSGLRWTLPGVEAVERVRDKRLTYQIAERVGVPCPRTAECTTREALAAALSDTTAFPLPVLMKPQDSGRFFAEHNMKAVTCDTVDEALAAWDRFEGFYGRVLLQELVPGPERNLVCLKAVLNRDSEPLAVFVDRKVRARREFLACSLAVSTWSDEVVELGLRLLKEVGYQGYASVEFKLDERTGQHELMEINGRISLNHTNALRAGLNLPAVMYDEALRGPLPPLGELRREFEAGVLWWCPWTDALNFVDAVRGGPGGVAGFVRSLVGRPRITEPLALDDPLPAVAITADSLRFVARKLARRRRETR